MATAQQRANSLAEQRQRFNRTGRLTKGLVNAGGFAAAEGQRDYTVQNGESLFSIAASTLGSGATPTQIAAYAQELAAANNGIQVLQSGAHIRLPGVVLSPDARPTKDFMDAANAQTVAGGFKVPESVQTMQRDLSLGAGTSTVAPAYSAAGFGLPAPAPYSPTRATQGLGTPAVNGLPTPSYNQQASQSLGVAPTPSYSPTQATQGVSGTLAAQDQLSRGLSTALQSRDTALASGAYGTPSTRGSSNPQSAGAQAHVNPWVEQQSAQLQGILAGIDAGAPGATLPAYIPASVAQATGLYESALVQLGYYQTSMTGNLYLSATAQAALNLPAGGNAVGDMGTVYDYNRTVRQGAGRAIGVSNFRPRRGGVGPIGSDVANDYSSYGGSLSGTWRVGF